MHPWPKEVIPTWHRWNTPCHILTLKTKQPHTVRTWSATIAFMHSFATITEHNRDSVQRRSGPPRGVPVSRILDYKRSFLTVSKNLKSVTCTIDTDRYSTGQTKSSNASRRSDSWYSFWAKHLPEVGAFGYLPLLSDLFPIWTPQIVMIPLSHDSDNRPIACQQASRRQLSSFAFWVLNGHIMPQLFRQFTLPIGVSM